MWSQQGYLEMTVNQNPISTLLDLHKDWTEVEVRRILLEAEKKMLKIKEKFTFHGEMEISFGGRMERH